MWQAQASMETTDLATARGSLAPAADLTPLLNQQDC
jgi:hypothetical protein